MSERFLREELRKERWRNASLAAGLQPLSSRVGVDFAILLSAEF